MCVLVSFSKPKDSMYMYLYYAYVLCLLVWFVCEYTHSDVWGELVPSHNRSLTHHPSKSTRAFWRESPCQMSPLTLQVYYLLPNWLWCFHQVTLLYLRSYSLANTPSHPWSVIIMWCNNCVVSNPGYVVYSIYGYTLAYVLHTRYLMGIKVICMIARAWGEADLGTGDVYKAIAHAHVYVHRLFNMQGH